MFGVGEDRLHEIRELDSEIERLKARIKEMNTYMRDTQEFLKSIPPSSLPTSYRIRRLELLRKGTDNGF